MGMRLLVLHGPNLNLLGVREGGRGLSDLDAALKARAKSLGMELTVLQSNHEGALLDALAAHREKVDGVLVNPAGLFGSYALKEGLELVGLPAIEVMLRPPARESVVAEACVLQVHGAGGFEPYLEALETFASGVFTPGSASKAPDGDDDLVQSPRRSKSAPAKALALAPSKTLGRKDSEADAPASKSGKSLGRKASSDEDDAPEPKGGKTLGRKASSDEDDAPASKGGKTLGRKASPSKDDAPESKGGKTLGRGTKSASVTTDLLTRALVHQKISDRLAGRLTAAELASWARSRYEALQRGLPAEQGQRAVLEEQLQRLTLSHLPSTRLSDEQLVDLMTRLDEG
ncbi:type II 3-dehydroquinate dehydratase [Myxococcus sp. XM-1-1-1]|uniref:type II 3-dehydroquinate dehydratase n=1 Tax=Myxococcus sp. XM-1-1-1 TaxID=2874602 RepID=UPI001CBF04AC|nr:type II 3-dehydroquinate dehydratase [Myxococcus sp. XM-1-1-1]